MSNPLDREIDMVASWISDLDLDIKKPGWDSYSAKPVTELAMAQALSFLFHLKGYPKPIEQVSVVPCSNGSLKVSVRVGGYD